MEAPRPTCPHCDSPDIQYSRGVIRHLLGVSPVIKCRHCPPDGFFLPHPAHAWRPCYISAEIIFTTDPHEIDESYRLTFDVREMRNSGGKIIDVLYHVTPVPERVPRGTSFPLYGGMG